MSGSVLVNECSSRKANVTLPARLKDRSLQDVLAACGASPPTIRTSSALLQGCSAGELRNTTHTAAAKAKPRAAMSANVVRQSKPSSPISSVDTTSEEQAAPNRPEKVDTAPCTKV